jgi:ankyrin repeat protein
MPGLTADADMEVFMRAFLHIVALLMVIPMSSSAQVPPSTRDVEGYRGLHEAAHQGDVAEIRALVAEGADLEARDAAGRTPIHVATFGSQDEALRVLADAGADLNALENSAYDIVTIAAVADDFAILDLALSLGASAANVTSPYDGTALIAAAHLGHHAVVERLIAGGAPLDHVNNLGWTALIEAVVLGNGGPDHVRTVRALIEAGADPTITDRQGATPLDHARARGYAEIISILEAGQTR